MNERGWGYKIANTEGKIYKNKRQKKQSKRLFFDAVFAYSIMKEFMSRKQVTFLA